MAHRLIEARKAEAPKLVTFTYTNPGSPDEPFQRAVESACGLSGIRMDLQEYPYIAPDKAGRASPSMWEPRLGEVADRMDRLGSSVFLTGQMGDLVMGNWIDDSEQVAERFREGRIAAGLREALAWSQSLHVPVYSIVWRGLTTCLGEWKPQENVDLQGTLAPDSMGVTMLPRLRDRSTALEAARTKDALWRRAAPSRRKHLWGLASFLDARALQCPEIMQEVSYAHPFAHRPMVEFMMNIPAEIVCRPGEPRSLMRRAFSELLPSSLVRRRSKGTFDAFFRTALTALAREALRDSKGMRLAERGYVDSANVGSHLMRYIQGLECNEAQLRHFLLLEFWLRGWEARAGVARKRAAMHPLAGPAAPASKPRDAPALGQRRAASFPR
jgi:hypothetical protein